MARTKELKADFGWAFGLNRFVLRIMGIWPSGNWRRASNSIRMPFMMLVMTLGLLLPELWALVMVFQEFQLVIDNLLTSSPTFTSCFKLLFMWRQAHGSYKLDFFRNYPNNEVLALEPVLKSSRYDWSRYSDKSGCWQLQVMRRHAGRARLVTIIDYCIIMGCFAFFVYTPLFGLNIRIINNITDYSNRHLMVQTIYPFDYSHSPLFEFTVFIQQLSCLFIAMAVSIPDNYFVALVMHASAQYEILGNDIEKLAQEGDSSLISGPLLHRKLARFIDRHVHLSRMVTLIEETFSFVTAVQVLCMISMVCCLGFETLMMLDPKMAANKPTFLQILTIIAMLFYIMLHTLVNCLASENLALRSEAIHTNIYNSQWYTMPSDKLRYLIPMMIMSKNPQQIKAGKILTMSMETYCKIVKTTAGYLSVLIAVTAE